MPDRAIPPVSTERPPARRSARPLRLRPAARGPVEEKVDRHGGLPVRVGPVLRERREDECTHGAAEEAREGIGVDRLEVARRDPLLDEGAEHGAKFLHVTQTARAEPGARGGRPREQPVLVRDGEERAVTLDVGEHACDAGLEPATEPLGVVSARAQLTEQLFGPFLEQRREHVVLLREVVVHGPHGDARPGGDVLDARAMEALLGEHRLGGVEDRVPEEGARLLSASGESIGRLVHCMNRGSPRPWPQQAFSVRPAPPRWHHRQTSRSTQAPAESTQATQSAPRPSATRATSVVVPLAATTSLAANAPSPHSAPISSTRAADGEALSGRTRATHVRPAATAAATGAGSSPFGYID